MSASREELLQHLHAMGYAPDSIAHFSDAELYGLWCQNYPLEYENYPNYGTNPPVVATQSQMPAQQVQPFTQHVRATPQQQQQQQTYHAEHERKHERNVMDDIAEADGHTTLGELAAVQVLLSRNKKNSKKPLRPRTGDLTKINVKTYMNQKEGIGELLGILKDEVARGKNIIKSIKIVALNTQKTTVMEVFCSDSRDAIAKYAQCRIQDLESLIVWLQDVADQLQHIITIRTAEQGAFAQVDSFKSISQRTTQLVTMHTELKTAIAQFAKVVEQGQ